MDFMNFLDSIFRWIHVVAGIIWIGHLYFFNWVNAHFVATLDAETKKKVVPELMPRALFWFRWGAAFTWVTGVLLLLMVFYHGKAAFDDPTNPSFVAALVMLALVLASPFIYDFLVSGPLKDPQTLFFAGIGISFAVLLLFALVGGFGFRGTAIHLGGMFGTIMAFNVWFRIWPAQQSIITATKNGTPPDAALVATAGTRSRHNTYMSVPLVFMMINMHATWAAQGAIVQAIILAVVVAVGWALTSHLYDQSKKVQGF